MTAGQELTIVYTDLDTIFDTRLGTLVAHCPEVVDEGFFDIYNRRVLDEFRGVSLEEFRELYKQRTPDILPNSPISEALRLISSICMEVASKLITNPSGKPPGVVVNTYPYQLEGGETADLTDLIAEFIPVETKVELVYMPPDQIDPAYCRANLSVMVLYDYEEWLALHVNGFLAMPCHKLTLVTPALLKKTPPPLSERGGITIPEMFDSVEQIASVFMKIQHAPVSSFGPVKL